MAIAYITAAVGLFSAFLAMGAIVYQAGRLAARVESLEAWRLQMNVELGNIHGAIRYTQEMIRGESV